MLNWFLGLFKGKSLADVLSETKTVRFNGIRFKIKKLDVMNFLDGSKIMMQYYDTFKMKSAGNQEHEVSHKKIREHMKEILVAGVVEPKLSMKEGEGYLVDDLFVNQKITNGLYEEIVKFTYGKKKIPKF